MKKGFLWFYAFKTLFSRNSNKVFRHIRAAVIGAAISLIPLVVVMVIADGMIQGIVDRYIELGSAHLQVRLPMATDTGRESEIIEKIENLENITLVYPYTQGSGLLYSRDGRTGITVRGIPEYVYQKDIGFAEYIEIYEGEFSLKEKDSLIISKETAGALKVKCGDSVKLLTVKNIPGRKMVLKPTKFTVKGIYSSGYQDLDMMCSFISEEYGKRLFEDADLRMLAIKTADAYNDNLNSTASEIKKIQSGIRVYTWKTLNDSLVATLGTTRKFLIFIMILIFLVTSVNISSSMIMIVISKKQDIAILKSMGASNLDISCIFMIQGLFIGVMAAFIGIVLGVLAAININQIITASEFVLNFVADNNFRMSETGFYLEKIPVVLNFRKLWGCGALALLFSIAATWFPAMKAGKIRPIEIFRKN